MKTIGVLFCMVLMWPLWGNGSPEFTESAVSFKLVCPGDRTVDCHEDLSDLSKFGSAYVLKDYVKKSAGTPVVTDLRNACGIGTILRTWTVEDPNWNMISCTQTITVVGTGLFTGHDITWPDSWTLDTCDINLHPRNLPARYGYPIFKRKDCSKPAYSYRDEVFNFGPRCKKVIRYWKVIDWCQYDPLKGGTKGSWEYIQVIKVDQKKKPDFPCPKDSVFYADNCQGTDVVLEDVFAIGFCGDSLEIKNTSKHADNNGNNASGYYPIGVHEFYYIAEYGCGREEKCRVKITVKDNKGPTPYCKNGIITTLMALDLDGDGICETGMRDIWASDLDAGSYHDCHPNQKLIFSFSSDTSDRSITFDCDNVGRNDVEIWVTDENGNQSFCKTYVMVQNNNPKLVDCEPDSLRNGRISGFLTTIDDLSLGTGMVSLFGPGAKMSTSTNHDTTIINGDTTIASNVDTSYSDIQLSNLSDDQGEYAFPPVPKWMGYELSASKNDDHFNGVDMMDAYSIYFHAINLSKIKDGDKLIAADVNEDGKINMSDFGLLIQALIFSNNPGTMFNSWKFVTKDYAENIPPNPFDSPIEEKYLVNQLSSSMSGVVFKGIKLGDINGDVDVSNTSPLVVRSSLGALIEDQQVEKDQEVIIDLKMNEAIATGLLRLEITGMSEVTIRGKKGIEHLSTEYNNGLYHLAFLSKLDREGVVVTIKGKVSTDGQISDLITMLPESEVFTAEGKGFEMNLTFREKKDLGLKIINVSPNPFRDNLHLEFYNSINGPVTVRVFDLDGRLVYTEEGSFDKGFKVWSLDLSNLEEKTTYFYQLLNSSGEHSGIILKQ